MPIWITDEEPQIEQKGIENYTKHDWEGMYAICGCSAEEQFKSF